MTPQATGLGSFESQLVQGIFASILQVNPAPSLPGDVFDSVVLKPSLVFVQDVATPVSTVRYIAESRRILDTPFEYEHPLKVVGRVVAGSRWTDLPIEFPDY